MIDFFVGLVWINVENMVRRYIFSIRLLRVIGIFGDIAHHYFDVRLWILIRVKLSNIYRPITIFSL